MNISNRTSQILILEVAVALWLGVTGVAAQPAAPLTREVVRIAEPATVEVWNRPILTLRAAIGALEPKERAANARQRIESLPYTALSEEVHVAPAKLGQLEGVMLYVGTQNIAGILPEDLDPESQQTLDQVGQQAAERLREVLRVRAEQRRIPVLMRGLGLSAAATLALVLILWGIARGRERSMRSIDRSTHTLSLRVFDVNLFPFLSTLERSLVKLMAFGLGLIGAYFWMTFVLLQFPYSKPWGERIGAFLRDILVQLGSGALNSAPGLFAVMVIFVLTRLVARGADRLLQGVEEGRHSLPFVEPETARATRKLAIAFIWIFAITVAYPYIPGSNTDAFKGVSVLVGLMVSLGSAGLVNQVMSGLVVVYSRALRTGDYVRVGDKEGVVSHVGMLSTKVVTFRREEITIPNAVLISDTVTNYSRLVAEQGAIVATTVTIGYDAPWRQVHALLLLAAERTPGVRQEPRPRVLQRALSDFYVEYQLLVSLSRPDDRIVVLSDLHAQIQDAFNEYGVQILSPHFQVQPEERVFVSKSHWHEAPAGHSRTNGPGQD
jgi:small-conductance mechanosensitive channel